MSKVLYTKNHVMIFIYLLVLNLLSTDSVDSAIGHCRTTWTGKNGKCKVLRKCQYTTDLQKKLGSSSKKYQHYLNNNFCGFNGYHPTICCPIVKLVKPKHDTVVHKKPSSQKANKPKKITITPSTTVPTIRKCELQTDKPAEYNPQTLLPEWCGISYDKRIVGGETAQLTEFPWLALLEYEKFSETILACSGSLISKRYVLTAGHCVSSIPENWQLKRVRLGEDNTETEKDCEPEGDDGLKCSDRVLILPIEQEIVHENFWKPNDYANDIALLRLGQDVTYTDYIQPICMAKSSDLGDAYWAAGWGQTESKSQSSMKLKVSLPKFNFNECAKIYASKNITLGDGQMCAGGVSGKDTCAGDSGSSLVRFATGSWVIDGIVSMGHRPCGYDGWPAVYTKVFYYVPWILSKLRP